jgi:heptosyltransferase-3
MPQSSFDPSTKFLLIAVPGIGDALLSTPLIHSLRQAYPKATIDVIVRKGSENILKQNTELNEVIAFPRRPTPHHYIQLIRRIFRRYDVAISTSPSDRSFINCLLAAPRRVSIAPAKSLQTLWKYLLAETIVPLDNQTHVIDQNLRLLDALNVKRQYEVILPQAANASDEIAAALQHTPTPKGYVVVHIVPGSDYKMWPTAHWKEVVQYLLDQNFEIVLTGGSSEKEQSICAEFQALSPSKIFNVCNKLTFSGVTHLIENAAAYVGTDTSTTHLAAATGALTFAIYGPSNIFKWSPWPKNHQQATPPFSRCCWGK